MSPALTACAKQRLPQLGPDNQGLRLVGGWAAAHRPNRPWDIRLHDFVELRDIRLHDVARLRHVRLHDFV